MELPLVNVSTCELRSVIRFFTAKNETAVNIHRNLVSVYGEECMSIQMVRRWRSWFLEGRQNVHDDERSCRPVTATDNAAVAAVRNVVEADRRVTIDEIMIRLPPGIEIGRSSIGTIMSDILNFRKVCARWVPRLLLENHKQQRMEAARAFLNKTTKHGVEEACGKSVPKKAKVTISAGKVMAMENFKWEIFTHPPYSPELAPSDFHLFPALKWHLGGKHFANDDEVQAEENHWLRRQDTAWYNSGIKKLLQRYQKCLDRNGVLDRLRFLPIKKMDQRTCIKFCVKNEIKCADAFRMLTVAYGEATLDRSNVYRWYKMFSEGREDVNDEECAGRPSTSTTDEKINEVEKMILANRRITVREVAEDLNISIGSCHSIFINDLGMRRVAAKFVPKLLNCDQKQHRMNIANEMLGSARDDPNLLQRVITGDEAWVYGYDVETKAQSSQWKLPHEPRPKKARQVRSNVKVYADSFLRLQGRGAS
ncbi:hypothetical protein LAZ67_16000594 [Cordylochernes scorpioides]|uniref:Mos1 transposase HTH domain-containing protein n=1 Tax=Cordylochernes scorpioides TaxID=51811 RepID=A0ABY6LEV6_9ARAC|nr:hypothetical protein LAZ67_16000594 [Cordylochernes scorpioides]